MLRPNRICSGVIARPSLLGERRLCGSAVGWLKDRNGSGVATRETFSPIGHRLAINGHEATFDGSVIPTFRRRLRNRERPFDSIRCKRIPCLINVTVHRRCSTARINCRETKFVRLEASS
jgi:hypothetical protein